MPAKKVTSDKKQVTRKKVILEGVKRPIESKLSKKDSIAPAGLQNDKKGGLSVPTYFLTGAKSATSLALPKEIFGGKINQALLRQALRVYLNNQQGHHAHTKTRGEVKYTTAKVWKQKGTGRARHGAKSAPIFVGGGVAMGPRKRSVVLDLPKKMKKAALISALSLKVKEGQVMGLTGLDKASGKTKEAVKLLGKVGKKTNLVVGDPQMVNAQRAVRNIPGVKFTSGLELNTLDVVKFQNLMITKEGLSQLESRLRKEIGDK